MRLNVVGLIDCAVADAKLDCFALVYQIGPGFICCLIGLAYLA